MAQQEGLVKNQNYMMGGKRKDRRRKKHKQKRIGSLTGWTPSATDCGHACAGWRSPQTRERRCQGTHAKPRLSLGPIHPERTSDRERERDMKRRMWSGYGKCPPDRKKIILLLPGDETKRCQVLVPGKSCSPAMSQHTSM